jgi:hypothetical protein
MTPRPLVPVVVLGLLMAAAPQAYRDPPPVAATTAELSAADLAAALHMRWWKYQLKFPERVRSCLVQICELRRTVHGGWEHVPLAPFEGCGSEEGLLEAEVKLVLLPGAEGDFLITVGRGTSWARFTTQPDFSGTYTTPMAATFVDGCLILAAEEKDPHIMTGREEDLVRAIALEITTQ